MYFYGLGFTPVVAPIVNPATAGQLVVPPGGMPLPAPIVPDPTAVVVAASPWYTTPIGIGAIAVAAFLGWRHFRKKAK